MEISVVLGLIHFYPVHLMEYKTALTNHNEC